MMRGRRQANFFKSAVDAPWWVGVVMAPAAYAGLKVLPGLTADVPILAPLARLLSQLAWVFAALFLMIAAISAVRRFSREAGRRRPRRFHPRPFPGAQPDGRVQAGDAARPEPISPPPYLSDMTAAPPDSWSLKLLRTLEWHRFEALIADFYDAQGYKARVTRHGADGGAEVELTLGEGQQPTALLQCRTWSAHKVGIKPVRELFGVMAARNLSRGILLTTGEFTKEAREFARGKPLELIGGVSLLVRILRMPADVSQALLERAAKGDYTTPTCPDCGIGMTLRSGRSGAFWGCVRYPRCWQTFALPHPQRPDNGSVRKRPGG